MLESLKKNKKGILLMLVSALSLAVGQLLWKFADLSNIGEKLTSFGGILQLILAIVCHRSPGDDHCPWER